MQVILKAFPVSTWLDKWFLVHVSQNLWLQERPNISSWI